MISSFALSKQELLDVYGEEALQCNFSNKELTVVFSQSKPFDYLELEELLQSVGWSRRPMMKVRRALDNSLLKVGLWKHDSKFPRLIGCARCTGDEVLEATVWDVAISPLYQGLGLGKQMMRYTLASLRSMDIRRVTLFADPGVVTFYKSQGWELEPKGNKCAFWYAS